jgi:hypothetical protein
VRFLVAAFWTYAGSTGAGTWPVTAAQAASAPISRAPTAPTLVSAAAPASYMLDLLIQKVSFREDRFFSPELSLSGFEFLDARPNSIQVPLQPISLSLERLKGLFLVQGVNAGIVPASATG